MRTCGRPINRAAPCQRFRTYIVLYVAVQSDPEGAGPRDYSPSSRELGTKARPN